MRVRRNFEQLPSEHVTICPIQWQSCDCDTMQMHIEV